MKYILRLLTLLFPLTLFCQDDQLARLSISGGVSELGISPAEEIWVATKAGNVYYTKRVGELWHIGPFGSLDPYNFSSGKTFERINFFSEDTLMISGFIQEGGKQDFVYWSGDHGKTWEQVIFGKSSWIDAAYINNNGKAWMSGNSQLIYYTEDKGRTWKAFEKIEPTGNLRFSTIHFAKDEITGLFGSFWNVLYRTKDNCKTWEKLPTPLSQNKYQRLSKEERPDFRKVRQFGEHYLVNQQGRVFITKTNKIDWRQLTEIIDFEVTESDNVYTINKDSVIELFDSQFNSIWKSTRKVDGYIRAIGVKNESLFILTGYSIFKINPKDFVKSDLFTNDIQISEPYLKVSYSGNEYGFEGADILIKNKNSRQWTRLMTVDFAIGNATTFNNQLIISDGRLKDYFSINPSTLTLDKFELPKSLFDLSVNRIEEFHIEIGSQGCFHSDNKRRSYYIRGNVFELNKKESKSDFLTNTPQTIDPSKIAELVKAIENSRFKKVTINELEITDKDITSFKRFIDNEEKRIKKSGIDKFDYNNLYSFPGERTDFDFYRNSADSISSLSSDIIDKVFWWGYGNWSTTTEWRRIVFVFQDKRKLIVENSDDKPNYLF